MKWDRRTLDYCGIMPHIGFRAQRLGLLITTLTDNRTEKMMVNEMKVGLMQGVLSSWIRRILQDLQYFKPWDLGHYSALQCRTCAISSRVYLKAWRVPGYSQ